MKPSELIEFLKTSEMHSEVNIEDASPQFMNELKVEWSKHPSAAPLVRALLDGRSEGFSDRYAAANPGAWEDEFQTAIHLWIDRLGFLVTNATPPFIYAVEFDLMDVFIAAVVEESLDRGAL
jgi:hypothetical protein